ncbi:MAG: formate/nitrite transporter family protein [Candidatus Nitrohelix vancouverensis]|uniref:Formate/nitrite transporter family protein n=1 Tax=Candidatus Nitrohelix vancouverensis TaxID=2705534 RepID=A0A7T0G4G9_9BACT|nr:MAG: formate/nitrite transporter family protein [Candidatus Nitrohelix vancouverensis]
MYTEEIQAMSNAAENKVVFMNRSPMGYFLLSALAGVYLGFGIVLIFSIGGPVAQSSFQPFLKLLMGASFGVALSLVVFAGAELFTGNNMVFAVGRLSRQMGYVTIVKLFAICFVGNLAGSLLLAWLVAESGVLGSSTRDLLATVAAGKMGLGVKEAFLRGVLCNWLVCLAVWIAARTKSETARLVMIFWCLFAFIGSGFEHSIANQSLLGLALMLPHGPEVSIMGFVYNQILVTAGNLVGGGIMVGAVYWFASQESKKADEENEVVSASLYDANSLNEIRVLPVRER